MTIALIILAIMLYAAGGLLLLKRELLGPIASFLALTAVYGSSTLLIPVNMLLTWLCITLVISAVSAMQPPEVMSQHRGMGYMCLGALGGMALGLTGYSFGATGNAVYALMVLGTLLGTAIGYVLFTRTPAGQALRQSRSRFVSYLLAKGFPVAIAVMQLGVVLTLLIMEKTKI